MSVAAKGWVYVPTGCQQASADKDCLLHVAFHGCLQTTADIQDKYYSKAGYNDWAEANNIVILYPQAVKSMFMPSNPNGCWDWWGYVSSNYAFREGPQMQMVKNMVSYLIES